MTHTVVTVLGRRSRLIEQAHVYFPGNPGYFKTDGLMRWEVQHGAVPVAPPIEKRAADWARDWAVVLKEGRKLDDETRFRDPKAGQDGKEGGGVNASVGASGAPHG